MILNALHIGEPIATYGSLLYLLLMGKKVATTVYITEKQQDLLKELNERSKVPIAEYIRQGIDLVLDKYSEMLPGQMDLPLGKKTPGAVDQQAEL